MRDVGLFLLRMTVGGLLAGHGAQKLFGMFEGPGLHGFGGHLESMGIRPGRAWAAMAGFSEFGGGALTALGLGGALGPIAAMGSMFMAATTVHWGKPIWVTSGGAEVPVAYMGALGSLALSGPGRFSLDRLFGVRVPRWMTALVLIGTALGIAQAHVTRQSATNAQPDVRQEPAQQPSSATDAQGATIGQPQLPQAA